MANRALPVIIQLVVFYIIVSWVVRLIRRRGQLMDKGKPDRPAGTEVGGIVSGPGTRPETTKPVWPPRPLSDSAVMSRAAPRRGALVERKDMMFNGVRWQVTFRPRHDAGAESRSARRDVYVEEPPRCPKCGLGVIESKSWLGYTWSCPECGLKKRSGRSMQDVAASLARMIR